MFGVSPIEMIVEIALSLLAVMCNFHNHFCPAELLPQMSKNVTCPIAIFLFFCQRVFLDRSVGNCYTFMVSYSKNRRGIIKRVSFHLLENVKKFPCSRGVSGALYLQSATVGVLFFLRIFSCRAALCKWR